MDLSRPRSKSLRVLSHYEERNWGARCGDASLARLVARGEARGDNK